MTLLAEMKLPGSAVLEFVVSPDGDGSRITTQAHFHPAGMPGLLYWYALWPIHRRIFDGLTRAIAERAETVSRASGDMPDAAASACPLASPSRGVFGATPIACDNPRS